MPLPAETINVILLASVVLLVVWDIYLTLVIRRLASNRLKLSTWLRKGPDVEEVIAKAIADLQGVNEKAARLEEVARRHRDLLGLTVKNVGVVRYDAFEDIGGKLSFSTALLDEHGTGIVLTSINGRQDSRVYAKPVNGKQSNYPLSREEEQAIELAGGVVATEARP